MNFNWQNITGLSIPATAADLLVLGLETSCDETGVALFHGRQGLLAHRLFSQIDIHADYGGVVPELASRDHVRKLVPLIRDTLSAGQTSLEQLGAIAYTAGPGLMGSLMAGASVAQGLAFALELPAIAVHHMEGHLLAPLLEPDPPGFPFLALLVSGGHTQLVDVAKYGCYRILGESLDDAAGEAFDKTAKMLGLGYPGGPRLAALAKRGDPGRFRFPRPMTDRPGFDFSFSGLKTHAQVTLAASPKDDASREDLAAGFEQAVADTLAIKCLRALKATRRTQLVVAGGVSANQRLRSQLDRSCRAEGVRVFYPRLDFCGDNGAMIALAGWLRAAKGDASSQRAIQVRPRWSLTALED